MKYLIACLISGVVGAGLFCAWGGVTTSSSGEIRLIQERRPAGRAFPGSAGPQRPRVISDQKNKDEEVTTFQPMPVPQEVFNSAGLTPEEVVNVTVYENVNRSVVNITTTTTKTDRLFLLESQAEGTGSGSVLDKEGHVLTNFHVVEDVQKVSATLFDGKSYDATFVGADPINDIAVIKIDAPPEILYPVTIGNSSRLKVGMRVFAIGNPFGLERTLTVGVVSSLNRSLTIHGNRAIKSIIQIDGSINPGNSGGPLLDSHGRLVGVNTAIASKTGQSAGVGFAIPVNLIARIVPQLIARGKVIRPEIGIGRVFQTEKGLLIASLTPGGPAEAAGLKGPQVTRKRHGVFVSERVDRNSADLIVGVNDKPVKTADDFLNYIEAYQPGDMVVLAIVRDGREIQVQVRLGGGEEPQVPAPSAQRGG